MIEISFRYDLKGLKMYATSMARSITIEEMSKMPRLYEMAPKYNYFNFYSE